MKIARNIGQPIQIRPRQAGPGNVDARKSFGKTQQHLHKAVRDLRSELAHTDLTPKQRAAAKEAFQRFQKSVGEISKDFRGSDANDPGPYQALLGKAGQDLFAAIGGILEEQESNPTQDSGPRVRSTGFGSGAIGGSINFKA